MAGRVLRSAYGLLLSGTMVQDVCALLKDENASERTLEPGLEPFQKRMQSMAQSNENVEQGGSETMMERKEGETTEHLMDLERIQQQQMEFENREKGNPFPKKESLLENTNSAIQIEGTSDMQVDGRSDGKSYMQVEEKSYMQVDGKSDKHHKSSDKSDDCCGHGGRHGDCCVHREVKAKESYQSLHRDQQSRAVIQKEIEKTTGNVLSKQSVRWFKYSVQGDFRMLAIFVVISFMFMLLGIPLYCKTLQDGTVKNYCGPWILGSLLKFLITVIEVFTIWLCCKNSIDKLKDNETLLFNYKDDTNDGKEPGSKTAYAKQKKKRINMVRLYPLIVNVSKHLTTLVFFHSWILLSYVPNWLYLTVFGRLDLEK